MNIIITNIGRRGYLVDFIRKTERFKGKIYVSDCDYTASGLYGDCDKFFILPKPVEDEKLYIKELLKLCKENDIKIIIPIIDPEIYILSKYKNQFEEEGILIITSSRRVLDICYDKINMNKFLSKNGFKVIPTYEDLRSFEEDFNDKQIDFPIFLKPILGSGSINSLKIENLEMLRLLFKPGMMIQKYIRGEEFGIDIFNNDKLKPVRVVVKKKLSMRSGETDKSLTVEDKSIFNLAIQLGEKLKHFGPLDCDILKDNKELYIIDMNPRFGGGYPATYNAGVNYIDLILCLYNNIDIKPEFNNYILNQLTLKSVKICSILNK